MMILLHHLVGHPIAGIFWFLGMNKAGDWIHDITAP